MYQSVIVTLIGIQQLTAANPVCQFVLHVKMNKPAKHALLIIVFNNRFVLELAMLLNIGFLMILLKFFLVYRSFFMLTLH